MQKTIDDVTYVLDKPASCQECVGYNNTVLCTKLGYDCLDLNKVWRIIEEKQNGKVA